MAPRPRGWSAKPRVSEETAGSPKDACRLSSHNLPERLVKKGLSTMALAALVAVAACGGDSGITEPTAPRTLLQPPTMTGGMHALGVDSVTGASIETNA